MSFDDDLPRRIRAALTDPHSVCSALSLLTKSKKQPGGIWILCPVHDDSDPSCSVRIGGDGTLCWKCMSCHATGDVLTLVATVHGLDTKRDFGAVLKAAGELAGIDTGRRTSTPPAPRPLRIVPPEPEAMSADEFASIVAPLENLGRLSAGPVAAYLDRRGLLDAARADGWFAVSSAAGEMLGSFFDRSRLIATGLFDDSGSLRWPQHPLCIPWRNVAGVVQTIQRRHLGECDAKRRYVFPNGRGPAHPYGLERIQPGPIALVEGAVDVLARRHADVLGWTTVIGVPGVSGWRAAWDELVRNRIVLIAFDDDDAGNAAALTLADRFYAAGAARVRRSTPTHGKDWADSMRRTA